MGTGNLEEASAKLIRTQDIINELILSQISALVQLQKIYNNYMYIFMTS